MHGLEKADFFFILEPPSICENLRSVYQDVWEIGANKALLNLFEFSETLVAGKALHNQLLQALATEKQQLLTLMELVTFFGSDQKSLNVIEKYAAVLGVGDTSLNFKFLESEITQAFSGISPVITPPLRNHATFAQSRNRCAITQPLRNHAIFAQSHNLCAITQPLRNHATFAQSDHATIAQSDHATIAQSDHAT
jgi:hypothetical protein